MLENLGIERGGFGLMAFGGVGFAVFKRDLQMLDQNARKFVVHVDVAAAHEQLFKRFGNLAALPVKFRQRAFLRFGNVRLILGDVVF